VLEKDGKEPLGISCYRQRIKQSQREQKLSAYNKTKEV